MGKPKKPQDHKQKTEDTPQVTDSSTYEEVTIKVEDGVDENGKPKVREVPGRRATVHGVTVEIPEEAFDDFELVDDLSMLDESDEEGMIRIPSILRRLLGPGYRRVYPALRGENGRISVEKGTQFVMDLVRALNPNS